MRRKRKKNGILALFAIFVVSAVAIRCVSGFGGEGFISACMERLAKNESFLRFGVSGETPLINGIDAKVWLESLALHPAVQIDEEVVGKKAEAKENSAEENKKEELVVWEFTPGGEKKQNTYPIENVTISPKSEKGYVKYENIWVKNDSSKGIDLKWLLGAKLPFKLVGEGPHVLIIHTHGSESYFPQGRDEYTLSDVERTEDKNYNMIRVGDEMKKALESEGIAVVHDRNIYDSPSYNGSYTRALDAIGNTLKENPSVKVIIDLHRDAMTSTDGVKYRTVANVNGERVAQMMLVMSTGESGLPHPDWAENLKLAVKLQNAMATKYPGIMRPINLRKERFNMHASLGSMLVEVGTSANSLSEAIASVKLLAKELAPILKTAK